MTNECSKGNQSKSRIQVIKLLKDWFGEEIKGIRINAVKGLFAYLVFNPIFINTAHNLANLTAHKCSSGPELMIDLYRQNHHRLLPSFLSEFY